MVIIVVAKIWHVFAATYFSEENKLSSFDIIRSQIRQKQTASSAVRACTGVASQNYIF